MGAFSIEKFAKYIFRRDDKIDLAYGKFSQKGNSVYNNVTYSYDPEYV